MNIIISNRGSTKLSSKLRNRLKHEIHKNLGKNACTLRSIPLEHPNNPKLNGYAIYTEIDKEDPKDIFKDIIVWGTNYLFGYIENSRTHQKIFFLVDIDELMYISENNRIIMPAENKKVIINVK